MSILIVNDPKNTETHNIISDSSFGVNNTNVIPDPSDTIIWPGEKIKDYKDGVTFIPDVSEEGIISWTNNGDLSNPPSRDIKGPQGDKGEDADIEGCNQAIIYATQQGDYAKQKADEINGFVNSNNEPLDNKCLWFDPSEEGSVLFYDDTELRNEIALKVDKEEGKGLSTNDYTDEDKLKLNSLKNISYIDDEDYIGKIYETVGWKN